MPLPLETEIKVRLSKAIRQLFNESYQDATNILAHLRAVPKLPNKIYTGTGNKWMSRALGLEIIRREGEAIRCDHGGSMSLLHPPEFVALNELAVSSKFYVTTKMAAELPELNDAVKLTNPIIKLFKYITPSFIIPLFVPLYVAWFFYMFRFYAMPYILGYDVMGMLSFPLESDISKEIYRLFNR